MQFLHEQYGIQLTVSSGAYSAQSSSDSVSVHDLLGTDKTKGNKSKGGGSSSPVIPDTEVTDDPFADLGGGSNGKGKGKKKYKVPYGSVQRIKKDRDSSDYVLGMLVADAKRSARAKGKVEPTTDKLESAYHEYSKKLVETLSKLTPEQQDYVFYGQ